MFRADFISISFAGRHIARYCEILRELSPETPTTFRFAGYDGLSYKEVGFVGYSDAKDRTLLSLYGPATEQVLLGFNERETKVNRLDLQKTVEVEKPDEVIEAVAKDGVTFKRTLVRRLDQPGATLYVGSETSERRLRLYNKSAQMGDPEGRFLRIEMVFRNQSAEGVWTVWRTIGTEERDAIAQKEVIKRAPSLWALGILNLPSVDVVLPKQQASAREWIENVVKPALTRLSVREPELVFELQRFLNGLVELSYPSREFVEKLHGTKIE